MFPTAWLSLESSVSLQTVVEQVLIWPAGAKLQKQESTLYCCVHTWCEFGFLSWPEQTLQSEKAHVLGASDLPSTKLVIQDSFRPEQWTQDCSRFLWFSRNSLKFAFASLVGNLTLEKHSHISMLFWGDMVAPPMMMMMMSSPLFPQ